MKLMINTVIRIETQNGKLLLERILWIDEGGIICFVINIDKEVKDFPTLRTISGIREGIENGSITIEEDSYSPFIHPEDVNENQINYRDNAWNIIKDIVVCEPDIFEKSKRGKMVRQVQDKMGIRSHNTVNKHLRKYWKMGKVKNALFDDLPNCGGRGKSKKIGVKKLGPKKKYKIDGEGVGVNEEIKRIFRLSYDEFYDDNKKAPLSHVYLEMKKKYFGEIYYDVDGVEQILLVNKDKIPSKRQFRYWAQNEPDIKKTIIKRFGSREYNLKYRARKSSTLAETYGPGVRFQIDATVCDFYLLSVFNKEWIVGRPVLYFLTDVFSRMIVGYYVGLEGPSWIGMMMAIANAATDKVNHCKQYGIDIQPSEWDVKCVPQFLLGDNGELKGKASAGLTYGLDVTVEYAPKFRGDFKSIVERDFGVFHGYTRRFVPGYVDKDHNKRGGKDYRLVDKKLNIIGFNRIIIKYILRHNNYFEITNYQLSKEMLVDEVVPIPREIWNWGMGKDFSKPRVFDEKTIKLNLMPTDKATVTRDGIKYKTMKYDCQKANDENWYSIAKIKGSWTVGISYDPRNLNKIYIREKGSTDFIVCTLNLDQKRYFDKSFDDIEYLHEKLTYNQKFRESEQDTHKINFEKELLQIVEEETKGITPNPDISKAKRIEGMTENRNFDKEKLGKKEAWVLDNPSETLMVDEVVSDINEEVNEITTEALPDHKKFEESLEEDNSTRSYFRKRRSGLFNGSG